VRCGQGTGENDRPERKFPAAEYFLQEVSSLSASEKKILHFYGNWMFISVFTSARHRTQTLETCFFILTYNHFTSLQTITVQIHHIFTFSSLNIHRTENSDVRHLYGFNSSTFL